ncbi:MULTISPECIES: MarR family transcriptional regulator [Acidianus]|uniref:TrmB family transcriptional regulator n=1 Tax=Candidatus Acidianus copahuensis TaxID=1160895 RepID=A0A031LQ24_9CREN|nr:MULTISPECIES: MarR family transcriptional regulator [Acidianus]EZQ07116.1 hypothetical protein CM19_06795 [Candidatus Acidianus copahuensis]NON63079.1 MarR family transcriptional regulator [Acidianus sp. RZ1]
MNQDLTFRYMSLTYQLNEVDYRIFDFLIRSEKEFTPKEIAEKLNLHKLIAMKSLNKLHYIGLAKREKILTGSKGRPSFKYFIKKDETLSKILRDADRFLEEVTKPMKK